MKIVIPMAGLGSRFEAKGYTKPKPLIEFLGKPMIQHVVEHLGLLDHKHVFLCQKGHVWKYRLHELFSHLLEDRYEIVEVDGLTEGAACTVLLADQVLNEDDPVLIVNSDQLVYWDKNSLSSENSSEDGCIFCFPGTGPNWSYVKVNEAGKVTQVAEKQEISEHATSGMYYWKKWKDFKTACNAMIAADDRTNGEFYVAPVYNYAEKKDIIIKYVNAVDQVGTPEELEQYLVEHGPTDNLRVS